MNAKLASRRHVPGPLRRLRAAAAPLAKTALLRSGGYAAIRRFLPSRRLAILRYHAVCGPEGHRYADPSICITPQHFEEHVACLTSRYNVLRLEDAVRALADGTALPANAVSITFDDGYADNLAAARMLARYGASATFYLTTGCIDGRLPFWPSELRELVHSVTAPSITLEPGDGRRVEISLNAGERGQVIRLISQLFKSRSIPDRERMREALRRQAGSPAYISPMLTWTEVAELQQLGMTIGGHTVTHPNLPSAGLDAAVAEIAGCRADIQQALGIDVKMFSYPNGGAERYVTPDLQRAVRGAGFDAATTSSNGFATRQSDLFALERVQVAHRVEDLLFALEVERLAFKPESRTQEA